MPFEAHRYPKDWKAISLRIREREGWKCKWCGVPNGAIGYRDKQGVFHPTSPEQLETMIIVDGDPIRPTKIVLTVAHLGTIHSDGRQGDKHDKMDCRDENLAALCQRCHLLYDIDEHITNASRTRERKRIAAGHQQLPIEAQP